MGQAEHQYSQAEVLHGRGRAEHLPAGVKLIQEIEMGQAEQKPEGKQEQRRRDDTICSSNLLDPLHRVLLRGMLVFQLEII